jgi:hypothetical protein
MDNERVYLLDVRRYYDGVPSDLPAITQDDDKLLALDSMARQARGPDGRFIDLLLARSDNSHADGPHSEDGQLGYDVVANIVLTPFWVPPGRSPRLCCMNCASC